MSVIDGEWGPVAWSPGNLLDPVPADRCRPAGLATNGQANLLAAGQAESLGRMTTLAATALSTPSASMVLAGTPSLPGMSGALGIDAQQSPFERLLCADILADGNKLIIGDTRVDRAAGNGSPPGPASMIAWAGVPVPNKDGGVAGVLWVADQVPRRWSANDVTVLETLALVASSDVALRAALARSAIRVALARTLEQSLLPPPLPDIPGLQVAARYAVAGTGAEALAFGYESLLRDGGV